MATDRLLRRQDFAEFRSAIERLAAWLGRDPRGLPDQLRQPGARDPRQVDRLADPRPAGRRRDRSRRRRPARGRPQGRATPALDEARREGDRVARSATPSAAGCCSRTPPAPRARWVATSASWRSCSRCSTATRGSASASTAATCSPPATRSATPTRWRRWSTSSTPSVGLDRLHCLHVNDSLIPLGGNRDRHASIGEGELGEAGHRDLPLRAALRRPAGAARDPGPRRQGPRPRRGRADQAAAERAESPPANGAGGDSCAGQRLADRRTPNQPNRTGRAKPRAADRGRDR